MFMKRMPPPVRTTVFVSSVVLLAGCFGDAKAPPDVVAEANQDSVEDRSRRADQQARLFTGVRYELASQEQWGIRESAADALARIGPAAVPALRVTLQDPDVETRIGACRVLARIGPGAVEATPDLTAIVADPNQPPNLRKTAALAIGQIGPPASDAIPVLLNAMREP